MDNQTNANNPVKGNEEIDLKQKAYTHLAQGKRHLLVKDYYEAANSLADACTFFDSLYGTGANECGEVYFNYGKALLELGRSESNVLGLGDNPDGKDDDESENSSDEDANENGEDEHENDGDTNDDEKVDGSEEGKGKEASASDAKGDAGEAVGSKMDESGAPEGDTEQEDEDNLKLAWEVLELAKTIFERQAKIDKQYELKLAEVYFKLCEVGLESGVYDQAIEDMKICVEIQKRNLSEDDRILAESFYELGIAYSLKNEYDVAITEFKNAIQVLEKRVSNLQEMLKQGVPAEVKDSDPFYSVEGEIKELNELIPEIRDRITDLQDAKKETMNFIRDQLIKEQQPAAGGEAACSSSSAPAPPPPAATDAKPAAVMDISHLVRRKRKLDSEVGDETCQKQACTEATVTDDKTTESCT